MVDHLTWFPEVFPAIQKYKLAQTDPTMITTNFMILPALRYYLPCEKWLENEAAIGSLMVTTLVPKFEAVFRQFYWKTIVSCRLRMTQSFKIRFSGEVNIILKTVKDQLTAFSTARWKFQTTVAPAMILKLRCSIFFIIFVLVSDQPTDQAINSMWKSVES